MTMAHKDICITAESGDGKRIYACYGFLRCYGSFKAEELSCLGDEMLRRIAKKPGKPLQEEEYQYILEHRFFKPNRELEKYYLATERHHPNFPQSLSYFHRRDGVWRQGWKDLSDQWMYDGLVIRRLT